MNNILFLDIDGVLNSQSWLRRTKKDRVEGETKEEHEDAHIDNSAVELVNKLCEAVNMKVVISSTWRMRRTTEELQGILNRNGATFEVIGKTPYMSGIPRGVEIAEWLGANTYKLFGVYDYNFNNYVIVDDDSDMLLNQAENFFNIDQGVGITEKTCYKIERFLNKLKPAK